MPSPASTPGGRRAARLRASPRPRRPPTARSSQPRPRQAPPRTRRPSEARRRTLLHLSQAGSWAVGRSTGGETGADGRATAADTTGAGALAADGSTGGAAARTAGGGAGAGVAGDAGCDTGAGVGGAGGAGASTAGGASRRQEPERDRDTPGRRPSSGCRDARTGRSTSAVPLGPTRADDRALGDDGVARDGDRTEMRQRHREPVGRLDRHRLAARRHRARRSSRHRPPARAPCAPATPRRCRCRGADRRRTDARGRT